MLRNLRAVSLVMILGCVGVLPSQAQQLTVQASRLDTAHVDILRRTIPSTHFSRKETIELDFKIDAAIDSISPLEGRGFIVLSGPGKGRSDNWTNGEHTFSEWRYYRIKARRRGRLVVPAMTVYSGGMEYRSEVLELEVGR